MSDNQYFTSYVFNDYAHQVVGNVYRLFLEYLSTHLYDVYKTRTISTYNKAVQQLLKPDIPRNTALPAIALDPTLPINFDEKFGNQLWRTPVAASQSRYNFEPIYQDENIRITPGFVRYTSLVSIYLWFDSIYQLIDAQLRYHQAFHGTNRFLKMFGMNVLCPLPDKVFLAHDDTTAQPINWNHATPTLLDTINKEIPMMQMYMSPLVRLDAIQSIGTRDKDSGEDIATCAAQMDITMEFEIPVFFIVESYWQVQQFKTLVIPGREMSFKVLSDLVQLTPNDDDTTNPSLDIHQPFSMILNNKMNLYDKDIKRWVYKEIKNDNDLEISITDIYQDFNRDDNELIVIKNHNIQNDYEINSLTNTLILPSGYINSLISIIII